MAKLPRFPTSTAFGVSVPRIDQIPQHTFTHHYAQIESYRFCQDSVILPWFVAQSTAPESIGPEFRALDLCAGCGVVGFELAHYLPSLHQLDFLELQPEFKDAFLKNLETTENSQKNYRWLDLNYATLAASAHEDSGHLKYDLIISNPPYFFPGDGKQSPNPIQNRCRFFIDSDLKSFVAAIGASLKPEGRAFFLCKLGGTHGRRSWDEIRMTAVAFSKQASIVCDIRGTAVVKIHDRVG